MTATPSAIAARASAALDSLAARLDAAEGYEFTPADGMDLMALRDCITALASVEPAPPPPSGEITAEAVKPAGSDPPAALDQTGQYPEGARADTPAGAAGSTPAASAGGADPGDIEGQTA